MPRTNSKFWQTSQFKELQKQWYEKLEQAEFSDAERNGKLCQKASNCYRTRAQSVIENKQRYYELLGQRHHDEVYSDPVEKYVMGRRSEGISCVQIKEELRAAGKKNSHEIIRRIIRHFEKRWGISKKNSRQLK